MEELSIDALRELRNASQAQTERDLNELKIMLDAPSRLNSLKAKGFLSPFKETSVKVSSWSDAIFSKVDRDQLVAEHAAQHKFMSVISEATVIAQEIIRISETSTYVPPKNNTTLSLPTIRLPYFEGNPIEFPTFMEAFKVVDDNDGISKSAKLTYLIGQLRGKALNAVDSFARIDANYNEALDVLKKRYGNVNVIINSHIDQLIHIKPPTREFTSFENFVGIIEANCRQLRSIAPSLIADDNFILARMIELKLPTTYREHLDRTSNTERWKLNDLRDELQKELSHLEKNKFPATFQKDNHDRNRKSYQKTTAAVAVSDRKNHSVESQRFKCYFCSGDHSIFNCTQYSTLQERKSRIYQLRLCVRCLRTNHREADCSRQYPCRNCDGDHHGILCPRSYSSTGQPLKNNFQQNNYKNNARSNHNSTTRPSFKQQNAQSSNNVVTSAEVTTNNAAIPASEPATTSSSTVGVNSISNNPQQVYRTVAALPTAVVHLCRNRGIYKVRTLFDLGAQRSFVLSEVAKKAKLRFIRKENLAINGFNSEGSRKSYDVVVVKIKTPHDTVEFEAVVINALPEVSNPPGMQMLAKELNAKGIQLADEFNDDVSIQLLVGADNYYKIVSCPTTDNVRLIESKIGSLISGPCPVSSVNESVNVNTISVLQVSVAPAPTDVNMLWELDQIGINPNEVHPDEELAQQMFEESIEHNGDHYIARLPWKASHSELPSNFGLARGRLLNNINSLKRTPEKFQLYHNVIMEQLENDFIEIVDETVPSSGKIHYIPHHAVYKASPTTPIRIVYDCSAKTGKYSTSLNDCLLSGPSLIPELTKVLMRLRINEFAVTADITKAFLRIGLNDFDRNSTRFFWVKDPSEPDVIVTYRFKSILFGATCSQFILNATIKCHLRDVPDEERNVANKIDRNIYVDNIISTANSVDEIDEFYAGSTKILSDAGLPLRGWATNATAVKNKFVDDNVHDERTKVPILGMIWDTESDILSLKHHPVDLELSTKRSILQAVASQYDPLGICAPIIIRGKLLMQELWRGGFDWDDLLSTELMESWSKIAVEFNRLNTIEIPRFELHAGKVSLHAFADASKTAYGAVIYAVQDEKISLLFAKGKVAPVKELTIPKLELTAATIATRLVKYVIDAYKEEFEVEQVHLYSDSKVALGWIKSNQSLPVFVQNRVNEIATSLPEACWHYVASADNPADILSRGTDVDTLKYHGIWWKGPGWLLETLPETVPEQREARVVALPAVVTTAIDSDQICNKIVAHCSSWEKAIRLHARLVKFIKLWKHRTSVKAFKTQVKNPLTSAEYKNSERNLLIAIQKIEFPEAYNYLKNSDKGKRPEIFDHLALGLDDNLIVCVSRLKFADMSETAKRPILLPSKHHITQLIIEEAHLRQLHMGVASTMACLREKYWIPKARQRIKHFIHRCVECKRERGTPYPTPPVPALPAVRVHESRPFANTGVDYCGPFNTGTLQQPVKRWVALFTCAATRAVHLEVADDLSAKSFMHVLHRFAARRSFPSVLISDNGTNFCAAANVLEQWKKHEELQKTLANQNCTWRFNPSRAPWFGGFFERLIKMTKQSLNKTLGHNRVSDTELRTLMCRIEAQLNDRPLTFVSDQLDDLPALTPSMLTNGFRLDSVPQPSIDPEDLNDPTVIDREMLTKRERHNQLIYQRLITRWSNEYLTMLRLQGQKSPPNIIPEVGDIVLIHDDVSRLLWPLGKIESTITGRDGYIRIAKVKTKNGIITRPIAKLYPLEIRQKALIPTVTEVEPESAVSGDVETIAECKNVVSKNVENRDGPGITGLLPARHAATKANKRIQKLFAAGNV